MNPENKLKLLCTRYVHRFHLEYLFIVLKVSDDKIFIPVDPPDSSANEVLDLPGRYRIVKLANSFTYDGQIRPVSAWRVCWRCFNVGWKRLSTNSTYGLTSSWRRQCWYPVLPFWCFQQKITSEGSGRGRRG